MGARSSSPGCLDPSTNPDLLEALRQIGAGPDGRIPGHAAAAGDTDRPRRQIDLATRMDETRHRKAGDVLPRPGRTHHPVGRTLHAPIGDILQHVAAVDDDLIMGGLDRQPGSVPLQQLQTGLGGPHQQRNEVDVLVGARADAAGVLPS